MWLELKSLHSSGCPHSSILPPKQGDCLPAEPSAILVFIEYNVGSRLQKVVGCVQSVDGSINRIAYDVGLTEFCNKCSVATTISSVVCVSGGSTYNVAAWQMRCQGLWAVFGCDNQMALLWRGVIFASRVSL